MNNDYTPPPVHPLSKEEELFLQTLTPKERTLHDLAIKKLGSSYVVWKSHAFQKWKEQKPK